jgi:hypothetical protein
MQARTCPGATASLDAGRAKKKTGPVKRPVSLFFVLVLFEDSWSKLELVLSRVRSD